MSRLLSINATLNWGSTGRIVEQIAQLAQKSGWDCYTAHGPRYIRESMTQTIQVSSEFDNRMHAIKSIFMGGHGLGSKHSTKLFVEAIKEINPDIIHLHNIHGYYINYPILFNYLKECNIPVVWTFHDCWPMTGQCTHFERIGCERWKSEKGCYNCPQLMASYKTIVDRSHRNWNLKKISFSAVENLTIVTVSEWLKNIVNESYLSKKTVKVIHNGVDLNCFKPTPVTRMELNLDEEKPVLLGVSSEWGEKKGIKDFIELAMDEKYQVVMIGVTEQQQKSLPSSIKAIKRTNNVQELVKYYSIADVFVNPTYEDSFPTVNIESLACGTPVITYCTGGSPEAIDEKTGIIVKQGDIKGIIKGIEIITSKNKDELSSICRRRAELLYNKDDRFKDYVDLYNNLIEL